MTDTVKGFALAAQTSTGQRAATPNTAALAANKDTRKAAEDFEAFFLTQSMESMFAGLGADKMFGGGSGEQIFRSLLIQEYGKATAHAGGVGIADAVQREMIRMQEAK